eukprot:1195191-Prorocentrum_minimum.AAC.1
MDATVIEEYKQAKRDAKSWKIVSAYIVSATLLEAKRATERTCNTRGCRAAKNKCNTCGCRATKNKCNTCGCRATKNICNTRGCRATKSICNTRGCRATSTITMSTCNSRQVEEWMGELEQRMRSSVASHMLQCLDAYDKIPWRQWMLE